VINQHGSDGKVAPHASIHQRCVSVHFPCIKVSPVINQHFGDIQAAMEASLNQCCASENVLCIHVSPVINQHLGNVRVALQDSKYQCCLSVLVLGIFQRIVFVKKTLKLWHVSCFGSFKHRIVIS
jgi:hypothetical protein